jgi:hypothetical protein
VRRFIAAFLPGFSVRLIRSQRRRREIVAKNRRRWLRVKQNLAHYEKQIGPGPNSEVPSIPRPGGYNKPILGEEELE